MTSYRLYLSHRAGLSQGAIALPCAVARTFTVGLQEAHLADGSVSSPPFLRGFVEADSEALENHVHDVAFLARGRLLSANL